MPAVMERTEKMPRNCDWCGEAIHGKEFTAMNSETKVFCSSQCVWNFDNFDDGDE